jgi:signal transduction histidine kinase
MDSEESITARGTARGASMNASQSALRSGRTILLVDDEADSFADVRPLIQDQGHRVLTADGGAAALAVLGIEPVQVIVVEHHMPVMTGEELVRRIRERDPLLQVVLQSGYVEDRPPRELMRSLAIQGYHDKGDGPERLVESVEVALRTYDQLVQMHIAERLKTDLLANVSHELRTPLNVIVGYIDLLRDGTFGPCPPDAAPVLEKMRGNAAHLLRLAEEFLDLSRLEAGALPMRREAVELTPFLRELGGWFAMLVRDKAVRFVSDLPDDLPAVAAEPAKLRIVVENLLTNAEKFTLEGEVRLSASLLADGRVAIAVSDTGPGIAPEHREAIFDRFHQLRPHDRQAKGVGLGLALARRFARLMGGDITLESTVGRGSTFAAVFPIAVITAPASDAA